MSRKAVLLLHRLSQWPS